MRAISCAQCEEVHDPNTPEDREEWLPSHAAVCPCREAVCGDCGATFKPKKMGQRERLVSCYDCALFWGFSHSRSCGFPCCLYHHLPTRARVRCPCFLLVMTPTHLRKCLPSVPAEIYILSNKRWYAQRRWIETHATEKCPLRPIACASCGARSVNKFRAAGERDSWLQHHMEAVCVYRPAKCERCHKELRSDSFASHRLAVQISTFSWHSLISMRY